MCVCVQLQSAVRELKRMALLPGIPPPALSWAPHVKLMDMLDPFRWGAAAACYSLVDMLGPFMWGLT